MSMEIDRTVWTNEILHLKWVSSGKFIYNKNEHENTIKVVLQQINKQLNKTPSQTLSCLILIHLWFHLYLLDVSGPTT